MVGASSHPLQAEVGVGSALKALGVRQVVAALWQVNVLASTYLMDRMYTYLGENDMTLRQALRRAQDDTRTLTREKLNSWTQQQRHIHPNDAWQSDRHDALDVLEHHHNSALPFANPYY